MESHTTAGRKTPNICIIGAGFSGLTTAIQLKLKLNYSTFTIYDENHEVGGTWLVNTYPGCACDAPSHFYSWSFELNPNWSNTYSGHKEILNYIISTAIKYDLYPHIQFKTQVKGLVWNDITKQWKVTVRNKETGNEQDKFYDIVINGHGLLRQPNYPKQFENFKGPILHSAAWDASTEWKNKIVGVVGSGASAVQIIPSIVSQVKELHCYQRTPTWVKSKILHGDINVALQWIFQYIPLVMWIYRCIIFLVAEFFWFGLLPSSWVSKMSRDSALRNLENQVPDKRLREKLTPNYMFGCKRIAYADNYFPAFNLPHVQLHTDEITGVMDQKIITADGTSQKIDVLVLATGFKVQDYFDPITITGKDSVDIMNLWKHEGPQLLYGIVGTDLPNQFLIHGPNTALGHSSVLFMIECQVNFVIQLIEEMIRRDSRCVTVKPVVVHNFMQSLEKQMQKTVWGNETCGSWYADARGVVTSLWPWNSTKYWTQTRTVDFEQFEFTN